MTPTIRWHRSVLGTLLLLLTVFGTRALAGPAAGSGGAAMSAAPPNVLLITMDALRPDRLGPYQYPRAETPAFDRIKKEGAIFEQAIVTSPRTLPSHASILTGLYPPRHGVRDDEDGVLDGKSSTLAQHLKAHGYQTAASVGAALFAGAVDLKRGFDGFEAPKRGSRSAAKVVDDALAAIDRMQGGPFFVWMQLDDARSSSLPQLAFEPRFASRPYDAQVAWMDSQVQRLLDHLEQRALLDRTIVVVTAAQAESLGEHGEETHGLLVYEATLRVPLLIRYPAKVHFGAEVRGMVSMVDLAPTLVDLIEAPAMPGVQGKSFAPGLQEVPLPEHEPVYAESLMGEKAFGWAPLYVLRTNKRKIIEGAKTEIYDIKRDPSETIDQAATDKQAVTSMRAQLLALRKAVGDVSAAPLPAGRKDPRSGVAVGNLFLKAKLSLEDGRPDGAVPLLEQAQRKDPKNQAITALLASLRAKPAATPAAAPDTFEGQWKLGNTLYAEGKLDDAAKAFRAALVLNPASGLAHYALGCVLAQQGDAAGAESELRAAVAADPKMADGWNKLGILLDRSKRRPEALDAFTRALAIEPDHPDALFNRAKLNYLDSKLPDARRDLDRLLKTQPDYALALFLDAHLCEAEKNTAGTKAALTKFLALPALDPKMKATAEDMLKKLGS